MRLPNAEKAFVEDRKVRDYLLSEGHPVGRFKARFFRRLGFDAERWREFAVALSALARGGDAVVGEENEFGQKYLVIGPLQGPSGTSAEVVSVWFIPKGGDIPTLVTVYPR